MNTPHKKTKSIKDPHLIHGHKLYVTSSSSHRGYKYFGSVYVHHVAAPSKATKFYSLLSKIRYVKRLKIPVALVIPNRKRILKYIQRFNKTTSYYRNTLTYVAAKQTQISMNKKILPRVIRNCQALSESLIPKAVPLKFLRHHRILKILKLNLTFYPAPIEGLLPVIAKMKHLEYCSLGLPVSADKNLGDIFREISKLPKIKGIGLSLSNTATVLSEGISVESNTLERFTLKASISISSLFPLIESLIEKNERLEEIDITCAKRDYSNDSPMSTDNVGKILALFNLKKDEVESCLQKHKDTKYLDFKDLNNAVKISFSSFHFVRK